MSHAEKIEKNVGEETTTTSGRPGRAEPPSTTLETMNDRWPSVFFTMPSLGVA